MIDDTNSEPSSAPALDDHHEQPEQEATEHIVVDSQPETSEESSPEPVASTETEETPEKPAETTAEVPKKSKKKLLLTLAFVLVNTAILSGTGYLLMHKQKQPNTAMSTTTEVKTTQGTTKSPDTPAEAPKTLHFTSDSLGFDFDYPSDWRIDSNSDNSFIIVQSAPFQVKQSDGSQKKVAATLIIYGKYDPDLDVQDSDRIVNDSEQLVYKDPTKIQRKQTFLSYAHSSQYFNTDVVSTAFISGNLQYKVGQSVGSQNFQKINPFIILKLIDCVDTCNPSFPSPVSRDEFVALDQLNTAKEMIKSMRFNK